MRAAAGFLVFALALFYPWWGQGKVLAPMDIVRELYEPWAAGDRQIRVHNHFTSDAVTQYLLYRRGAEKSYREDGRVGWSSLTYGGIAQYANTMAGYFDWTMQLHRGLEFWLAWHLGLLGQILIAGIGMLVFLRGRGYSPPVQLMGAVAYAANTQFVVWVNHRWALGSFCWMPWVLWLVAQERAGRRWAWPLVPGFLALAFLGGTLQQAAFVVVAIGGLWAGWGRGRGGTYAAWTVLGIGLAGMMFVPSVEAYLLNLQAGNHRGGVGYPGGWKPTAAEPGTVPADGVSFLAGQRPEPGRGQASGRRPVRGGVIRVRAGVGSGGAAGAEKVPAGGGLAHGVGTGGAADAAGGTTVSPILAGLHLGRGVGIRGVLGAGRGTGLGEAVLVGKRVVGGGERGSVAGGGVVAAVVGASGAGASRGRAVFRAAGVAGAKGGAVLSGVVLVERPAVGAVGAGAGWGAGAAAPGRLGDGGSDGGGGVRVLVPLGDVRAGAGSGVSNARGASTTGSGGARGPSLDRGGPGGTPLSAGEHAAGVRCGNDPRIRKHHAAGDVAAGWLHRRRAGPGADGSDARGRAGRRGATGRGVGGSAPGEATRDLPKPVRGEPVHAGGGAGGGGDRKPARAGGAGGGGVDPGGRELGAGVAGASGAWRVEGGGAGAGREHDDTAG